MAIAYLGGSLRFEWLPESFRHSGQSKIQAQKTPYETGRNSFNRYYYLFDARGSVTARGTDIDSINPPRRIQGYAS